MIKKSLLTILTTFSLYGCSTVVDVHEPLDCLGQPEVSLNLTPEEFEQIPKPALKKIKVFGKTLRARIDAQCELVDKHNLEH